MDARRFFFDIPISVLALVVFFIPMLFVPLVVRVDSKGPAIFKQTRLTKAGREFTIFKIRTYYLEGEAQSGITRVGRFLRKSKLDEVPQFLNVLLGDMSVVGPRPIEPHRHAEVCKSLADYDRRLDVLAGITGPAQLFEGRDTNLEATKRRLDLELDYIEGRSFMSDIAYVFLTFRLMFSGKD